VRWERLFADLETQFAAADDDELAAELADRTRAEVARVSVADRLRAATGTSIEVVLEGGHLVSGPVARTGAGWLLLDTGGAGSALVVTTAITELRGLGVDAVPPAALDPVAARLDLGHVLRGIARDRSAGAIGLVDGRILHATIDRVGRDFIDVAAPSVEDSRRSGVRRWCLTFGALAVLRPG